MAAITAATKKYGRIFAVFHLVLFTGFARRRADPKEVAAMPSASRTVWPAQNDEQEASVPEGFLDAWRIAATCGAIAYGGSCDDLG
jgi:hypothetical protein